MGTGIWSRTVIVPHSLSARKDLPSIWRSTKTSRRRIEYQNRNAACAKS
jgi:hypothetical protein